MAQYPITLTDSSDSCSWLLKDFCKANADPYLHEGQKKAAKVQIKVLIRKSSLSVQKLEIILKYSASEVYVILILALRS